jgi:hypothetical protein
VKWCYDTIVKEQDRDYDEDESEKGKEFIVLVKRLPKMKNLKEDILMVLRNIHFHFKKQ